MWSKICFSHSVKLQKIMTHIFQVTYMYCFAKLLHTKFLKIPTMSGTWFTTLVPMWNHSSTPLKNSIPGILPKSCLLTSLEASGKFLFFLRSVLAINETNSPFSLTMGSFPETQRRKAYTAMIQHLAPPSNKELPL